MKKLSGSFTIEALYTELIKEISFPIKTLPGNPSEIIRTEIEKSQTASVKVRNSI